jgi:hypothetical protein
MVPRSVVDAPRPHYRHHLGVATKSSSNANMTPWTAFWSNVRDTLAVGRPRSSRRRDKVLYVRHKGPHQDANGAGGGTHSATHRCAEDQTSQVTDAVSLSGTAATTASSSSSFPIKNVLLVVSLPTAPPVVDYGNAAFLSMENQDYCQSLPLRKKWVSDNGSVSSISTVTLDPAVQLARDMRYPQQRSNSTRSGSARPCRPAPPPPRHTVFTMDAILCDDSKTNCCSSITMITEENDEYDTTGVAIDPEAADLAEIARVPLVEI